MLSTFLVQSFIDWICDCLPIAKISCPSCTTDNLKHNFPKKSRGPFSKGEMIRPTTGFVILGFIAAWLLIAILRGLSRIA